MWMVNGQMSRLVASISWKQKSAIRWSGRLAASGRVILIHLEKVKRGRSTFLPSVLWMEHVLPYHQLISELENRQPGWRTDWRTDDRYQDARLLTYGGAASKSFVAHAWFEARLMTLYQPKFLLIVDRDETVIKSNKSKVNPGQAVRVPGG